MAAAEAYQGFATAEKRIITEEYGGKLSNKFIEELKSATLFQCDWGELLSAAPTALSLMGSCWLAAANPTAETISLANVVPEGGFKHMTKLRNPTLRACLVDVCNNGGRQAFTIAGKNMDALHMTSQRICDERIQIVFKRLGPCTTSRDALEDFEDALKDLSSDAKRCAQLATEMREAFSKWGMMVGELHMCSENQKSNTMIRADVVKTEERMAVIEKTFTDKASKNTEDQVMKAGQALTKSESRLDKAIHDVPSPWMTVIHGAIICHTQTIPTIMAGVLPAILCGGNNSTDGVAQGGSSQEKPPLPALDDPSYASATEIRDLVNHFWDFIGNDNDPIVWEKFKEPQESCIDKPQGLAYFLGTLQGQQQNTDVTGTKANNELMEVYCSLIKVGTEIQVHLNQQNQINAVTSPGNDVVQDWKTRVKSARANVLKLAASANAMSSSSVPRPFGNMIMQQVQIESSAQMAPLNTALQTVQMAQAAVESAQLSYDAALDKQTKTAMAMAAIQTKLQKLHKEGQSLDKIKDVLRDCISVLVDLAVQIGKLEQFFIMLVNVIDNIVMPRAETFTRDMAKAGNRALRDGVFRLDDFTKQTIYTSTLQIKGYFSILQDISGMYTHVHQKYISEGVDLCYRLSKGTASNDSTLELQQRLDDYSRTSAKDIAALVTAKQDEVLSSLKHRARKALEYTQLIENEVAKRGIAIDQSAKSAIQDGGRAHNADAQNIVNSEVGQTCSEDVDASQS